MCGPRRAGRWPAGTEALPYRWAEGGQVAARGGGHPPPKPTCGDMLAQIRPAVNCPLCPPCRGAVGRATRPASISPWLKSEPRQRGGGALGGGAPGVYGRTPGGGCGGSGFEAAGVGCDCSPQPAPRLSSSSTTLIAVRRVRRVCFASVTYKNPRGGSRGSPGGGLPRLPGLLVAPVPTRFFRAGGNRGHGESDSDSLSGYGHCALSGRTTGFSQGVALPPTMRFSTTIFACPSA